MTITAERPVTEPSVEDLAGVFNDVNSAVGAARRAFVAFSECSLAQRRAFVDAVREAATQQDRLEYMASAAVQETRMGNAHHKVLKNRYAATRTPGVEDLIRVMTDSPPSSTAPTGSSAPSLRRPTPPKPSSATPSACSRQVTPSSSAPTRGPVISVPGWSTSSTAR